MYRWAVCYNVRSNSLAETFCCLLFLISLQLDHLQLSKHTLSLSAELTPPAPHPTSIHLTSLELTINTIRLNSMCKVCIRPHSPLVKKPVSFSGCLPDTRAVFLQRWDTDTTIQFLPSENCKVLVNILLSILWFFENEVHKGAKEIIAFSVFLLLLYDPPNIRWKIRKFTHNV